MPPTYRQRLRTEGLGLALCGAIGTIVLLAVSAQAHGDPLSTAGQLAVVALLLAWLGPRSVHRAIAASEARSERDLGSGEPTPVWRLPLIVVVLAGAAGLVAGWDAGVRVTGGCALVGLARRWCSSGSSRQTSTRPGERTSGSRARASCAERASVTSRLTLSKSDLAR